VLKDARRIAKTLSPEKRAVVEQICSEIEAMMRELADLQAKGQVRTTQFNIAPHNRIYTCSTTCMYVVYSFLKFYYKRVLLRIFHSRGTALVLKSWLLSSVLRWTSLRKSFNLRSLRK